MALIGQIAISMTTDARQFNAGIMQATASLRAFSRLGATLGKVSPLTGIGIGAFTAVKGLSQIASQARKLVPNLLMLGSGVPREMGFSFGKAFSSIGVGLAKTVGGLGIMAASVARVGVGLAGWGLSVVTRGLGIFIGTVREAINTLGRFAAIASVVAGAALWHVARGAMALGEQTDAARVIFGDFTDEVVSQSKLMATAFGVSRKAYLQSAQSFGTIFQGAGYDEKASATISNHMMRLAADTSSLKHLDIQVVMEKMQSGLQGNIKPLRELGVSMAEVDVQAYAAKNGIAQLGHEMTESQKIQARLGLMTERLAKANGNLALTYGSPANQVRSLSGRIENLSDTIGTAINTILGPAISELTVGIQATQMAWDASALAAASASVGVVGGAQGQTEAIGMVQQSIGFVADAWQAVGLAFAKTQMLITSGLSWMIENLPGFASGVNKIQEAFTGIKVSTDDFKKTWVADLEVMRAAQEKTFQAKLAAPAASEGINAAFAAARAQIKAAQEEVKKTAPSIAGLKPKESAAEKAKEVKFASAMSRGSSEAASTILRSKYSGGKTNDEMKKVSNNTAKANEHLAKIASVVGATGMGLALMENF